MTAAATEENALGEDRLAQLQAAVDVPQLAPRAVATQVAQWLTEAELGTGVGLPPAALPGSDELPSWAQLGAASLADTAPVSVCQPEAASPAPDKPEAASRAPVAVDVTGDDATTTPDTGTPPIELDPRHDTVFAPIQEENPCRQLPPVPEETFHEPIHEPPPHEAAFVPPISAPQRRKATLPRMRQKARKPKQRSRFRCCEPGCGKSFSSQTALHTHIGWHRRKSNVESGEYDSRDHPSKRTFRSTDSSGNTVVVQEFCCPLAGCNKKFSRRGALATHLGWHRRVQR
eukprot:COSAG04_NODE_2972_length_3328_cov_3.067203_2_plen_288_part_00